MTSNGGGPREASVHGDYERSFCVPANAWDRELAALFGSPEPERSGRELRIRVPGCGVGVYRL